MRICIPVNEDQGLQSEVCAHFGSAPAFLIVDTDSGDCRAIVNRNQHHSHGMCTPLASLQGEILDGIVVGGIGMGALNKLMAAGISVFRAAHPTVMATIESFKAGTLAPMQPGMACGGHRHAERDLEIGADFHPPIVAGRASPARRRRPAAACSPAPRAPGW